MTAANVQLTEQRKKAVESQETAEQAGKAERWERYRSNIAAAAAALQLQNSGMARRALEAAPPEHRNWEWRHLHTQLDSARAVMSGAPMTSRLLSQRPIISPSGVQLATVDRDTCAITLWDATTGTALITLRGHEGPVQALVYSPDGRRIASGSADKTIRLWDPATGKVVAVLRGHAKPVEWLTYSPDGQQLCSRDGESGRLWDAATGRPITVLGGPVGHFAGLFMPDGRRLLVGLGRQVCLLDPKTGRQIAVLGTHEQQVIHLAVSLDGKRIASHGDHEKTIRLWDGVTGREVAVLRGHTVSPLVLAFSPDGSRLASGSSYPDNTLRLWDAANGRLIAAPAGPQEYDPLGWRSARIAGALFRLPLIRQPGCGTV